MFVKKCLFCNKDFSKKRTVSVDMWKNNTKFCSTNCKKLYMVGKKQSINQVLLKTKYPRSFTCIICDKEIANKSGVKNIRFCSRKCQGEHIRKKDKNKQPKTILTQKIRGCFLYRQWRSDILTRDKHRCVDCWSIKSLHVHHIKSIATILKENCVKTFEQALLVEELWNINNGITVCIDCHQEYHPNIRIVRDVIK